MRQKEEIFPLKFWQKAIVFGNIGFGIAYYIGWGLVLEPKHPFYSWAFYLVELIGFLSSFMFLFSTLKLRRREPPTLTSRPTVDVFIATYNEPTEVLLTTIYHCKNMDYPHETYLLDDGNRPEIKKLAEDLGVHYLSRPDNRHAKAGNLNHAFSRTKGQIIATFDADGVPRKDFLINLLGYFEDPTVALVQTPQTFYNLDSFQHVNDAGENIMWNEQSLFFDIIQPGRDYHEAAMCVGSGSLFRRSALEEVGGFSVGTVTEDLHTTLNLHFKGHKSVYNPRPLAFCLAPSSLYGYILQRGRWALGTVQVLRKEWRRLFAPGSLTLAQRLAYRMSLYYFTAIQRAFYYISPFLFLTLGISPISGEDWYVIPILLRMVLSVSSYYVVSRGRARLFLTEMFFLYTLVAYLNSLMQGLIPFWNPRFQVTSKSPSGSFPWRLLGFPFFVLILSIGAILSGMHQLWDNQFNMGVLVAACFAWFHGAVSLCAIASARKKPVSEECFSFFDFRPLEIKKVNGISPIGQASPGVVTVLSEKSLRIVCAESYPLGTLLTVELTLPHNTLTADLVVSHLRSIVLRGQEPLFEMNLEFSKLSDEGRRDLIRYFFEDAAPRTFASVVSGRRMKNKVSEKRRHTRAPVLMPVWVETPNATSKSNRQVLLGLVEDLSTTGARIKVQFPIPLGTKAEVQIPWNKSRVTAKVVRCIRVAEQVNPSYEIGLEYDSEVALTQDHLASAGIRKRSIP